MATIEKMILVLVYFTACFGVWGSILRRLNKGSNNYFRVERNEDQKYVCVRRPLDWLFLATIRGANDGLICHHQKN